MLARHAENLFWAGRYLERAEDTARILDATQHGTIIRPDAAVQWGDLLTVIRVRSEFTETGREVNGHEVSEFLVADAESPGSVISSVRTARENLRSVREHLPTEVWEAANRFHHELENRDLVADLDGEPYTLFLVIKGWCQTMSGVIEQTMPRDDGYRFLNLGMLLERAVMTTRLLSIRWAHLSTGTFDDAHLTLSSVSAVEAFRRLKSPSLEPMAVGAFLLQDPVFPRSVLYCLMRAETLLGRLSDQPPDMGRTERVLGRVRSGLEFADVDHPSVDLPAACAELDEGIRSVADAMTAQYFRNADLQPGSPLGTASVPLGGRR